MAAGRAVARSRPPPGFDLGQRGGSFGEQPCEHGRDLGGVFRINDRRLWGQTIRTTAGWRVRSTAGMWTGRINSTVIVVSVPLMVPPANVVKGDVVGRAELAFRLGPGSSGGSPSGAARLGRGYFAPSRSQARREYAQMHSVRSFLIRDDLDEPAKEFGPPGRPD